MQTISYSQMTTFKQCRLKWWYSYGLDLEPKKPSRALLFGDLTHRLLADYYSGVHDADVVVRDFRNEALAQFDYFEEEIALLDDDIDMVLAIMERYREFAQENDAWEVVGVEVPFELKVYKPGGVRACCALVGFIDLLVRDDRGRLWIVEHKTAATLPDEESLVLDDQLSTYAYAVKTLMQEPVQGIWYNVLRKKLPSVPAVNKNGSISRRKDIDTEPSVYLQAVLDAGEDPAAYADILQHIADNATPFFYRLRSYRTDHELEVLGAALYDIWRDIRNKNKALYRSPDASCAWKCSFRDVCVTAMKGGDEQYLLDTGFRPKEGRRKHADHHAASAHLGRQLRRP